MISNVLTEKKKSEKSSSEDESDDANDDTPCQKCQKFDHPEWVIDQLCLYTSSTF